uniref:DUF1589 domain-containing protein n=1 Tax=Paracoccus lichenicola TaxID=2665644 RepID=UPI0038B35EA1
MLSTGRSTATSTRPTGAARSSIPPPKTPCGASWPRRGMPTSWSRPTASASSTGNCWRASSRRPGPAR